jgi:hypothetical protein
MYDFLHPVMLRTLSVSKFLMTNTPETFFCLLHLFQIKYHFSYVSIGVHVYSIFYAAGQVLIQMHI